ncbi:MAG: hypothetical protein PHP08_00275 [Candidatus Dojkabacteria bacterium]|nr:hypothetical protein [Candidatus Dojkabacteria bacterium]
MVDRMKEADELFIKEREEFFKQAQNSQQKRSRSEKAIPEGNIETRKFKNYYDNNSTITLAQATNPNDPDVNTYNRERIFVSVERNAEQVIVSNDGTDTLFVIVSHGGEMQWSRERPVYPGENKIYYNVYELRLRSPTASLPYRVSEYPICCTGNSLTSSGTSSGTMFAGSVFAARGNPTRAVININTSGDNTIIAAPATSGQRIRIVNLFFIAASAVGVILKSGANNLTGVMSFAGNSGMGFNGDFNPLQMNANQAFIINLNGNIQVSGFVLYYTE